MRGASKAAAGLILSVLALGPGTSHAQEKIRYVRDWISIPLRESPAAESTIVHKGIVSGTALTVLQTDATAGSARVRTDKGIEGWVPLRYLTDEPGARAELDKAELEIERLTKLNEQLRLGAPSVAALQESSSRLSADAQAEKTRLTAQIDDLKRNIGDNSKLVQEHAELSKHATELQDQVTRLNTQITELQSGSQQEFFRDGALAVGGGAVLTLIAAYFWPRKRRSEWV